MACEGFNKAVKIYLFMCGQLKYMQITKPQRKSFSCFMVLHLLLLNQRYENNGRLSTVSFSHNNEQTFLTKMQVLDVDTLKHYTLYDQGQVQTIRIMQPCHVDFQFHNNCNIQACTVYDRQFVLRTHYGVEHFLLKSFTDAVGKPQRSTFLGPWERLMMHHLSLRTWDQPGVISPFGSL